MNVFVRAFLTNMPKLLQTVREKSAPKDAKSSLLNIVHAMSLLVARGQISGCARRNPQLLNIPYCRTAAGQKSLRCRKETISNNMVGSDLKLYHKNVKVFKKNLKKRLLKQYLEK